jgi:hypothetical protein
MPRFLQKAIAHPSPRVAFTARVRYEYTGYCAPHQPVNPRVHDPACSTSSRTLAASQASPWTTRARRTRCPAVLATKRDNDNQRRTRAHPKHRPAQTVTEPIRASKVRARPIRPNRIARRADRQNRSRDEHTPMNPHAPASPGGGRRPGGGGQSPRRARARKRGRHRPPLRPSRNGFRADAWEIPWSGMLGHAGTGPDGRLLMLGGVAVGVYRAMR